MPRLVRRLVLSYAPENAVIEAVGPLTGIYAPSGPKTDQKFHPLPCPPALASLDEESDPPRGHSGQTNEAHSSSFLSVPGGHSY